MNNEIKQYYEVLGLSINADARAVKQAYRQLAKIWHPDNFCHDLQQQQKAEIQFKIIVNAYESLKYYLEQEHHINKSGNIHIKKSNPNFHYHQGTIYAEEDQYEEAIAEFSKAIGLDDTYIKAYQYRGFIFSKLGYENRANADFKKVNQLKLKDIHKKSSSTSDGKDNQKKPQDKTTKKTEPYQEKVSNVKIEQKFSNVSKSLKRWKVKNILAGHSQPVNLISISANAKLLASVAHSKIIKLWNLSTGSEITLLSKHKSFVRCLKFTPDHQYLISGSEDKKIIIWDLKNYKGKILGNWRNGHNQAVLSLNISSDGQYLISGSADKTTKIWSLKSEMAPYTISGYSKEILDIAITHDGEFFVAGGIENILRIRKVDEGKIVRSLKINSGITSLAFSPNNHLLVTGGFDRIIRVWNWKQGDEIAQIRGHLDIINKLFFSHDGKQLISVSPQEKIKIWDLDSLEQIDNLNHNHHRVLACDLSQDRKTLVTGCEDSKIRVFELYS